MAFSFRKRSWFSSIFRTARFLESLERNERRQSRPWVRLYLETLEARIVPTVLFDYPLVANAANANSLLASGDTGARLNGAKVELIFWGNEWTSSPGLVADMGSVTAAVQSILSVSSGTYTSGLAQYFPTTNQGVSTFQAPNYHGVEPPVTSSVPTPFHETDLQSIIPPTNLMGTPNTFYFVFVEPGATYSHNPKLGSLTDDTLGNHAFIGTVANPVYYGWSLTSDPTDPTGKFDLDIATRIFSHELVETISDPNGKGVQVAPRSPTEWNELADGRPEETPFDYRLNGYEVQAYLSAQDNAYIVPDGNKEQLSVSNKGVLTIVGDDSTGGDTIRLSEVAAPESPGSTVMVEKLKVDFADVQGDLAPQVFQFDPDTITSVKVEEGPGPGAAPVTLTLDFTNGNFMVDTAPTGSPIPVSFVGGTGATLNLKSGNFTNDIDDPSDSNGGVITLDSKSIITYSHVSAIIDTVPATNFTLIDPKPNAKINIGPNSLENNVQTTEVSSTNTHFADVNFANKTNVTITVADASRASTFIVDDPTPAAGLKDLDISGATKNGADFGDTVDLVATPTHVTTTWTAGANDATINVGYASKSVQSIGGPLILTSSSHALNFVTFDDSTDMTSRTVNVGSSQVDGLFASVNTYCQFDHVAELTIFSGSVGNNYEVNGTPSGTDSSNIATTDLFNGDSFVIDGLGSYSDNNFFGSGGVNTFNLDDQLAQNPQPIDATLSILGGSNNGNSISLPAGFILTRSNGTSTQGLLGSIICNFTNVLVNSSSGLTLTLYANGLSLQTTWDIIAPGEINISVEDMADSEHFTYKFKNALFPIDNLISDSGFAPNYVDIGTAEPEAILTSAPTGPDMTSRSNTVADTFKFSAGATMGTITGDNNPGSSAGIVGPAEDNTWEINAKDAGGIDEVLTSFENVQKLTGGGVEDTFDFANCSIPTDMQNANLTGNLTGSFTTSLIGKIVGDPLNPNGATIIGLDDSSETWKITGTDAGSIGNNSSTLYNVSHSVSLAFNDFVYSFKDVGNLTGGNLDDKFRLPSKPGVSITGTVDGGASGNLGNKIDGHLLPVDAAWDITGPNAGHVGNDAATDIINRFMNIDHLFGGKGNDSFDFSESGTMDSIDGGSGDNTIDGPSNTSNIWEISQLNQGTIGDTSFTDVQNLGGGGLKDTYVFDSPDSMGKSAGMLTGMITGEPTAPGASAAQIAAAANNATIIGPDAIGLDPAVTWNITGSDQGDIPGVLPETSGVPGTPGFINVGNITGGSGADTFNLMTGGNITGHLDGGSTADANFYNTIVNDSGLEYTWDLTAENAGSIGSDPAITSLVGPGSPPPSINNIVNSYADIQNVTGGTNLDVFHFAPLQGNGGKDYTVGDTLTVQGGVYTTPATPTPATPTPATLTVLAVNSDGAITSVMVNTDDNGNDGDYSLLPPNPVSVTGGKGWGATFTLTGAEATSQDGSLTVTNAVVSGGYQVGEVLTVVGGVLGTLQPGSTTPLTAAMLKVLTVENGAVTSVAVLSGGTYSTEPNATVNVADPTGGGGIDATFSLTFSFDSTIRSFAVATASVVADGGPSLLDGSIADTTGGSEWLDYSAIPVSVNVNLKSGAASFVNTSVTGVNNVIGSANGGDTFIGSAAGGVLIGHNTFVTDRDTNHGNTIHAGIGASVIVGGQGVDFNTPFQNQLIGGTDGDLFIDGTTTYQSNPTALAAILGMWQAGQVAALQSASSAYHLIVGTTVTLEHAIDAGVGTIIGFGGFDYETTLVGGPNRNWFFTVSAQAIVNFKTGDILTTS